MANEPLDLASLIARLRSAGLKTDIRQYLAAHELLLAMAGQRRELENDAEALVSHLGPIFCGSPEEQQLFRHEFLAWRGGTRPTTTPLQREGRKNTRRNWVAIACVVAALTGVTGALIWYLRPVPPTPIVEPPPSPSPPPETGKPPPKSSFVVSPPKMVASDDVLVESPRKAAVPWLTIIAGGLGAAAMTFLALWWREKARRDYVLSRLSPDPNTKRIELSPAPPTLTNIRPLALRRISAGLRRTRANEVFDLSVAATVNATANAGGFVVPVFAPRVAIPEYLVLIDRRSESDHSAQLIFGWVTQLCDQGVAADCYEFDSDPRVCREFGTQRSQRLPALLARHHRATVLLCAESEVCIDPMTNRPQPWLRSFNSLPNRVFLNLAPPYRWAAHEQRLLDAGFILVPATPSGLHIAAAMDRNSLEAIGQGAKYSREFPRLIAQDSLRWLDRNPPPEATASRLLRALHDFLGPDGYSWLCACAVYPQVSWPITLKLLDALLPPGTEIPARRAIDEQLPAIARLPWFRYGYMPDWLRRLLISHLDPERETRIRATLEQLVCGLLDGEKSGDSGTRDEVSSKLSIRIRPKALEIARAAPAESPLQDEVFLGFLAGAAPDPLSLRLSSLPFTGAPRTRSLGTRMREGWRALGVRRPLLLRSVISCVVAIPVSVILWAALRETPLPIEVPDSDITYYLASSDLSSSETMVAVAPNGQFMLLASPKAGNFVEVWDLVRNEVRFRIPTDAEVRVLSISPRSDRIAIFDQDENIYLSDSEGAIERIRNVMELPYSFARPDRVFAKLIFSDDSSRLLVHAPSLIKVFDTRTRLELASKDQTVEAAVFSPGNPDQIMVFDGVALRNFDARSLTSIGVDRRFPAIQFQFSLDGRYFMRENGQSGDLEVSLHDSVTGNTLTAKPFQTRTKWNGWVWSGDGNLVAYEEGPRANAIYDLSSDQKLITQESIISATNRLYTIRFARSKQRRPNYTYYAISERSIDVVPSPAEPVPIPVPKPVPATTKRNPTNDKQDIPTPSTSSQADRVTEAKTREALATLVPEVRTLAQQLVARARKQGITVQVTAGRRVGESALHFSGVEEFRRLHESGRAFDVAVKLENGAWSIAESKRMSAVGQIGKSLGLTWGGDQGEYSHFELPPKEDSTPPAAELPPRENQAPQGAEQTTQTIQGPQQGPAVPPAANANVSPETSQAFRLERTEFEYPQNRGTELESDSSGIVYTTDRKTVGLFELRIDPISQNQNAFVGKIVLSARALDDIYRNFPAPTPPGARETSYNYIVSDEVTISSQEIAQSGDTIRVINVGILQFTLRVEVVGPLPSTGRLTFNRRSLRIHISVQPRAEGYEPNRSPTKSK